MSAVYTVHCAGPEPEIKKSIGERNSRWKSQFNIKNSIKNVNKILNWIK